MPQREKGGGLYFPPTLSLYEVTDKNTTVSHLPRAVVDQHHDALLSPVMVSVLVRLDSTAGCKCLANIRNCGNRLDLPTQ